MKPHLAGEFREHLQRAVFVERLVLLRPEDPGEVLGQETTQREIRVGHRQRAVLHVTRGSGMCSRALRPDHEEARPEEKHRSTARRDCVDVQLQFNVHLSESEDSVASHG